jgi:hypothetical protein
VSLEKFFMIQSKYPSGKCISKIGCKKRMYITCHLHRHGQGHKSIKPAIPIIKDKSFRANRKT